MDMNIEDTKLAVFSFLDLEDIKNYSLTNKENLEYFDNSSYLWKDFGERKYPSFEIKCKKDFLDSPVIVTEEEIQKYISSYPWLTKVYSISFVNKNKVADHLVPNMVKAISKHMVKVEKYRKLYPKTKGDSRYVLNMQIEFHLSESENIRKDLEEYI